MKKIVMLSLSLLLFVACQSGATVTSTPAQPVTVTSSQPAAPAPSSPSAETPVTDETGPHFLLSTTDAVKLQRDGWSDYHPTEFGAVLAPADLLNVDNKVRVLCVGEELVVKTVVSGQNRVPCPYEAGLLTYRGARFSTRRMGSAGVSDIPFILYPRSTLLLTARPTIYWNDTGAGNYSVMLTQDGQDVWAKPKMASDNMLPYPADEAPLATGKNYRIVVTDDDSQISSHKNEPPGTGFALATKEEKAKIEADAAKITTLADLTDNERRFALGIYYIGIPEEFATMKFSPIGEAWLAIEPLQTSTPAPAVYLLYGDIMGRMNLPDLADKAYLTAKDTAANLGDLESEATANARLWCSTADKQYYQEAERLFKDLGDQQQLEALPKDATDC